MSIKTDAPDLVEPLFDEASNAVAKGIFGVALPEIIKELPILKYVKTATDVYSAYRISKLHRRLKAFLDALQDGSFTLDDFYKLSRDQQESVVDILVTELDGQSDNLQAEALGYLFAVYMSKDIDRLIFLGVAHELKNINPLVFYFNVDSYTFDDAARLESSVASNFGFSNALMPIQIKSGPVQYLPSTFISGSTSASGAFQISSSAYMTNLGEAFFKYVYRPMQQKHTI